jgi:hypothetical protein
MSTSSRSPVFDLSDDRLEPLWRAFDHDFSNFAANCEKDKRATEATGDVLVGSDRFVINSGTGMGSAAPGAVATEDIVNLHHPNPRVKRR